MTFSRDAYICIIKVSVFTLLSSCSLVYIFSDSSSLFKSSLFPRIVVFYFPPVNFYQASTGMTFSRDAYICIIKVSVFTLLSSCSLVYIFSDSSSLFKSSLFHYFVYNRFLKYIKLKIFRIIARN